MMFGDVFYADLSPTIGDELGGIRPVVVIKDNSATTVTVVPVCYSTKSNSGEQALFYLDNSAIPFGKLALQIRTIDRRRLSERIGTASSNGIKELKRLLESFCRQA